MLLELIQNADDNNYDLSVIPKFELRATNDYIWVTNNEKGFTEANVRAICDIGGSTKANVKLIGHKGIGFKSVFKISDTPHIFSRDFQFKFNVNQPLGYIVPEWINEDQLPPEIPTIDGTHFYLPFKKGHDFNPQELLDGIDHVPMFLHKLRNLNIEVQGEETVKRKHVIVTYEDPTLCHLSITSTEIMLSSGLVINEYNQKLSYRIFRSQFNIPSSWQEEDKRRGSETEIILAFPVTLNSSYTDYPIFSFLPVQSAGFKFIIQADFQLVASRQEVHKNKQWNIWLRDKIAALFLKALQKDDDIKLNLEYFLPAVSQVVDSFWSPVLNQIRQVLLNAECVKTESNHWAKPSDVFVKLPQFEDLISNDELLACTGKEFISSSYTDRQYLIENLGCPVLGVKDILKCLQHKNFQVESKTIKWFHSLYSFLQRYSFDANTVKTFLQQSKIFPLIQSKNIDKLNVGSIRDGPIYSSMCVTSSTYDFDDSIRIIHPKLVDNDTKGFLQQMGIRRATISDIITSILVQHSNYR